MTLLLDAAFRRPPRPILNTLQGVSRDQSAGESGVAEENESGPVNRILVEYDGTDGSICSDLAAAQHVEQFQLGGVECIAGG